MIEYSQEELKEYDKLISLTELPDVNNAIRRVDARIELMKFIEKQGHEKCDAMWEIVKDW